MKPIDHRTVLYLLPINHPHDTIFPHTKGEKLVPQILGHQFTVQTKNISHSKSYIYSTKYSIKLVSPSSNCRKRWLKVTVQSLTNMRRFMSPERGPTKINRSPKSASSFFKTLMIIYLSINETNPTNMLSQYAQKC